MFIVDSVLWHHYLVDLSRVNVLMVFSCTALCGRWVRPMQTCSYCTFRVFSPKFSSQDAGSWKYSKLRPTLLLLCLDSKIPAYMVEGGLDNGKKVTKVGFLLGPEGLASKLWASCTCFSLYLLYVKVDLGNFSSSCRLS
jgi:hypothetical protein